MDFQPFRAVRLLGLSKLERSGGPSLIPVQLIPTAAERPVWGRGSGDRLVVANTDIGKVGGLIWSVGRMVMRLSLCSGLLQLGKLHACC